MGKGLRCIGEAVLMNNPFVREGDFVDIIFIAFLSL